MSTTQDQQDTTGVPVTPRVVSLPTCGCGQDLDGCSGRHCPRCGTQLGSFVVEAVGFWRAA